MNLQLKAVGLAVALALTGCASGSAYIKSEDARFEKTKKAIDDSEKKLAKETKQPTFVKGRGVWLGGKSMSIGATPDLPDVFKQQWTFSFPGRLNIATISERLTKVTGIPVRIAPDVYIPTAKFIRGGGTSLNPNSTSSTPTDATGAPLTTPTTPNTLPAQVTEAFGASTTNAKSGQDAYQVNFEGTLEDFLNTFCAQANIDWEYRDGSIELYRLITKTFVIKASPGDSAFTASVGKTGVTAGGNAGGAGGAGANGGQSTFSADGSSKMASKYNIWTSIDASIKSILSPVGKISINESTGTIIVTDTKKIVDLVDNLIKKENAIMTRQVRLKVEFLSVTVAKEHESGIDWNVVYRNLNAALDPRFTLNIGTPSSLATAQAGNVGFTINDTGLGTASDKFAGTQAMLKALSAFGKASLVTTTSALTLNRQPVPVTLTDQVGYLAATTPGVAAVGATGASTPGLTPGLITTGYVLNMLPTVMDTGNVLLQFAIDVSELKRINTVTSGIGNNQQSIQTPEVSSTQLLQRATIKAGETLVLAGFERDNGQYDRRGLTEGTSDFTGTTKGKTTKIASVIMITPVVENGE